MGLDGRFRKMNRSMPNPIVIFAWLVGAIAVLFTIRVTEWEDLLTHRNLAGVALSFFGYVTLTNYLRGRISWHFSRAIQVYLFSTMAMLFYSFHHAMISILFLGIGVGACVLVGVYLRIAFPPKSIATEYS